MVLAVLALSLLEGADHVDWPLQLCTADRVRIERRYDMSATGHVRCTAGTVVITGREATVRANEDESVVTIEFKGGARLTNQRDSIGGDRLAVRLAHLGNDWILRGVQVEYVAVRLRPAEPEK